MIASPIPSPLPTGLSADEVRQIGETFGMFFGVLALILLVLIAAGMGLVLYLVTGD